MQTYFIKRGDTLPLLEATLLSPSNTALTLTGCTVKLRYRIRDLGIVEEKDAEIVDDQRGVVRYVWQTGDTDVPGIWDGEWVVTYPDGEILSTPNDTYFRLYIQGEGKYAVVKTQTQTAYLLRRLRLKLGDRERKLYPDDNFLAQSLVDGFGAFLSLMTVDYGLEDDDTDPLATDTELTYEEKEAWALLAAKDFLQAEILEASRIAVIMRTPAGQQNLQEVHKALRLVLEDINAQLADVLDPASVSFVDMTSVDGRVTDAT